MSKTPTLEELLGDIERANDTLQYMRYHLNRANLSGSEYKTLLEITSQTYILSVEKSKFFITPEQYERFKTHHDNTVSGAGRKYQEIYNSMLSIGYYFKK